MYVLCRDKLGQTQLVPCTELLVLNSQHQPLVVAVEHTPDVIVASNYEDDDFDATYRRLGDQLKRAVSYTG